MKRLWIGIVAIGFSMGLNAQEAADKEIQAGLIVGYGMNFQSMKTKLMQTNGVGSDLTIGANVNFSLTETIGFTTGVEFDFETLKFKAPNDNPVFYGYKDENNTLIESGDTTSIGTGFVLDTRKQKPMYITIPTMLSFRTNFIGYFRYFGKFGLRTSVLLSNKFTDEGDRINGLLEIEENVTNEDMTAKGEMFPIKSAVGLAGGAEWNFVGSTCLMAEIGYYYGFTPLYRDRKDGEKYLYSLFNGEFSNAANQSQLMLKVSILF